jgi:predicted nucleic acid-binding protein
MASVSVFFDSDVLIAGSASKSGASHVLLQLSELKFINGLASERVIEECNRNLLKKLPDALEPFKKIIDCSITIVPDPTDQQCTMYKEMAHEKDRIILTAAIQNKESILLPSIQNIISPLIQ